MAAHELCVLSFVAASLQGADLAFGSGRYKHNWRYHKDLRLWLTKEAGTEPTQKTQSYERGSYMCVPFAGSVYRSMLTRFSTASSILRCGNECGRTLFSCVPLPTRLWSVADRFDALAGLRFAREAAAVGTADLPCGYEVRLLSLVRLVRTLADLVVACS